MVIGSVGVGHGVNIKVHVRVRISLLLVFWQRIEIILGLFI